jgi:hypothetical protein
MHKPRGTRWRTLRRRAANKLGYRESGGDPKCQVELVEEKMRALKIAIVDQLPAVADA